MIESLAWVLPRPRKVNKFLGGFPLHFEKKLLGLLGIDPAEHKILHSFGGKAEFGVKLDINPEVEPDVVGDAHNLPFGDSVFDVVILDPPYTESYSKKLYGTGKVYFRKYTAEAVRVLKEGGYLVMYHWVATPSIKGTLLVKRILMETRAWHKARIVHIHQKDTDAWAKIDRQGVPWTAWQSKPNWRTIET